MMFNKNKKPFSLRARFLMATAGVILALSLSYGMVAVVGYIVSFDKTAFRLLRGESNLFFSLAQWKDNKLTSTRPRSQLSYPGVYLRRQGQSAVEPAPVAGAGKAHQQRVAGKIRLLRN
jgi:hypothetical protein